MVEPTKCTQYTCGPLFPDTSLHCVKGEIIKKVVALADVGLGYDVCNATQDFFVAESDFKDYASGMVAAPCSAAPFLAVRKAIESACVGKAACTINTTMLTATHGCAHLAGQLGVSVECQAKGGIDALSLLTLLLICIIALATGTTITVDTMKDVWATKKRAFLVGIASQFGFMPLMAFIFSKALNFTTLSAVGVLLVGMAPGGSTSNLFTMWAKGNVSLSIAMSVASTICAFFMIPLLFVIYVKVGLGLDKTAVRLPMANLFIALLSIVLPVAGGAYIRHKNTTKKCGKLFIYEVVEKTGSIIGALFLIAAVVTGVRGNPALMVPSKYPAHWGLAALFQPLGCTFGLVVSKLVKLTAADARAVSLETGVQNYALIIAICALSFKGCVRTEVEAFVIIGSLWYVISSVWLVLALRFVHTKFDEDVGPEGSHKMQDTELAGKAGAGGPDV